MVSSDAPVIHTGSKTYNSAQVVCVVLLLPQTPGDVVVGEMRGGTEKCAFDDLPLSLRAIRKGVLEEDIGEHCVDTMLDDAANTTVLFFKLQLTTLWIHDLDTRVHRVGIGRGNIVDV